MRPGAGSVGSPCCHWRHAQGPFKPSTSHAQPARAATCPDSAGCYLLGQPGARFPSYVLPETLGRRVAHPEMGPNVLRFPPDTPTWSSTLFTLRPWWYMSEEQSIWHRCPYRIQHPHIRFRVPSPTTSSSRCPQTPSMLLSPSTPEQLPLHTRLGSPFRERPPDLSSTRADCSPRRAPPTPPTPNARGYEGELRAAHLLSSPDDTAERRQRRRPPLTMKGRILHYDEGRQSSLPRRRPLMELDLDSPCPYRRPGSSSHDSAPFSSPCGCNGPLSPPSSSAVLSSDSTELLTPYVPMNGTRTAIENNESSRRSWPDHLVGCERDIWTGGLPDPPHGPPISRRFTLASLPSTPSRIARGLRPSQIARISQIRIPSSTGPGPASGRGSAGDRDRAIATGYDSESINHSCRSVD